MAGKWWGHSPTVRPRVVLVHSRPPREVTANLAQSPATGQALPAGRPFRELDRRGRPCEPTGAFARLPALSHQRTATGTGQPSARGETAPAPREPSCHISLPKSY